MTERSYSEMLSFPNFIDRFNYLSLNGAVGTETFGFERWMNQSFYTSREWRQLRQHIIVRDGGCDLACADYEIHEKLVIHHINPMTPDDFEHNNPAMLDPENLITTTHNTHNAIHYGSSELLRVLPAPRRPGDTKLW